MGPSARERALLDLVRGIEGDAKADRLREGFETWVSPPPSFGWGAMAYVARRDGRPEPEPNTTPWAHLGRVLASN